MQKVAVILAGCGHFDGSEIHESVLTLLRLSEHGAQVQCFAPDVSQMHVINHRSQDVMENETRNVLTEAARICRGDIQNVAMANAENFDALIIPGGYGAAKNLCDFAVNGKNCRVREDVLTFAKKFHQQGKPIGLICIAPVMAPLIFGQGVICTVGNDPDTTSAIQSMGGVHQNCAVENIVVDTEKKLVTTPAYMLGQNISDVSKGIFKLVDKVLAMA